MALLCLLTNTPWPWPTPAGAASARGGVSPPLERSGSGVEGAERSGGLHKRSAEDWGASCRAPGTESLRKAWLRCICAERRRCFSLLLHLGWALRAGERPAERAPEGYFFLSAGGRETPLLKLAL